MISTEQVNKSNEDGIKEYHLKKLAELSLKSIESLRDIPELEEPSYEQKQFIKSWRPHK